jgi:type II secretory ATPase GspE/PulE/Tfp pilus assembly ATPase PilB-like protein
MPEARAESWPLPPYFAPGADAAGSAEPCVAERFGGTPVEGNLATFRPEDGVIEVAKPGSPASLVVPTELRRLRLTRLIELVPEPDRFSGKDVRLSADKRGFVVRYRDGTGDDGETRGFLHDRRGTYLYVVRGARQCERWYVPDSAGRLRIGESLADILVRENLADAAQVAQARALRDAAHAQKLGEVLTQNKVVTPQQLDEALRTQRGLPSARLGDILVDNGLLSVADLERALKIQLRNRALPLSEVLVRSGLARAEDVVRGLAIKLGVPSVDVRSFEIQGKALELLPFDMARAASVLPLSRDETSLVVAAARLLEPDTLKQLQFVTGLRVVPVLAVAADLEARLQQEYGTRKSRAGAATAAAPAPNNETPARELALQLDAETMREPARGRIEEESDSKLVRLVNRMVLDAQAQGASDIHIETNPGSSRTRIRLRRDGVMVDYLDLPASVRAAVVSRIKIMSSLDISEHRHPQDGKIGFHQPGSADLDLRVAVIPTAGGLEDVVIRLLSSSKPPPIDKLGLTKADLANVKRLAERSFGLFLVCGPTGSGKTTTLHSILSFINMPELKIWTAEDPIEIRQAGLRQVQVNPRIGFTFSAALRSFLRADPDVIMVGEIRDAETARISVEASLTGHLVFSTLHTNSAAESVVRLLDLGMDPFNFADALLGILAQRLARRLCAQCRDPKAASDAELEELAADYCKGTLLQVPATIDSWRRELADASGRIRLWRAVGCEACAGSGYRGRLGIYELLVSSAAVKVLIQAKSPVNELLRILMSEGMHTLMQDGVLKVLQGLTDLRQVRAACS